MTVKIDQALISRFIAGDFGLPIAHENVAYSPDGNEYAELLVIPNDTTPLNLSHTDETDGIFRIILRYPTRSGGMAGKVKADEILNYFKIGQSLSYDGQALTIIRRKRAEGVPETGWHKTVVTITYKAFITR